MFRSLAVALSVCALAATAESPSLELSAHVVVEHAPVEFGGLSAVNVGAGGKRAQVMSDRGRLFEVGLWRDEDETLRRVVVLRTKYLYVYDPRHEVDSEGLASAPGGGVFVSSESPSAVLHYPARSSWPDRTWPIPDIGSVKSNRGLEALAIDSDGRLVTIPETPPDGETDFPIFRLEEDEWHQIATLAGLGGFAVVGAEFGPQGRLYVLERAFSLLGFRSRIRRVTLTEGSARAETLFESRLDQYDNLEGISLWQDGTGALRILLVSDDNFLPIQRTEFVEFVLRE